MFYLLERRARRSLPAAAAARGGGGGQAAPQDIGAWLHIGEDGQITVYTGKAEVGQNIRTSLTQVVAEELHVAPGSIHLVMADTQLTPFDMGTFGSRTTPDMSRQLGARPPPLASCLIDLAAETWKADRVAAVGRRRGRSSTRKTKESLDFGKLTKGQKLTKTVADDVADQPRPRSGRSPATRRPKVDGRAFVTGKHQYASDVKLPGMLFGKVLRPPSFGATLVSVDTSRGQGDAGRGRGPRRRFRRRRRAQRDRRPRARWRRSRRSGSPVRTVSGKDLFDDLKRARPGRGAAEEAAETRASEPVRSRRGWTPRDVRSSKPTRSPTSPMRRSSRARPSREWDDGKLTVWTGTQRPFGVRGELAGAFRLPETRVRVIVPDTGAGYGGKHTGEAAVEAARLARAAGKPVKLVWTREEEFTWAYFRPAGVIEVNSGVRKDGTLTAWEFHNYNSGGSGIRTPYEVPNQLVAFHQASIAAAAGLLPRAGRPRPTTSPASRTWTSWPMPCRSTRWSSA